MEDVRQYPTDYDDTLRLPIDDDVPVEREAAAEDELPFEIPRD